MAFIFDLIVAFAMLGLIEALFKPIAKRVVKNRILKYAPQLFKALDPVLPYLVLNGDTETIEQVVKEKLEELTGESWASASVDPIFSLYDPRVNAARFRS